MNEFENVGVNDGEIATTQIESQQPDVQDTDASSEVVEPNLVQDAETNAHYAEQRRKQELDEYRSRAEGYEQNLNRVAQLSGFNTHDELLQAVEEAEKQRERQQYEDAGIDPDQFNQLLEKHPDIQFAREQRAKQEEESKFNGEVTAFFEKHPDIQPKDIPNEVWAIREQEGLSLVHAYRSHMYDNVRQTSEQSALQKLQQNQTTSTGPLGGSDVEHNTSISKMSNSDFAALQQKVMRGEKVQF